jgi:hypothetical protein
LLIHGWGKAFATGSVRLPNTGRASAMKTLIHFVRDDSPAAFVLILVAVIAILKLSHIRISDIDGLIQKSTHALSAGPELCCIDLSTFAACAE